jgi:hypothetical protein
MLTVTWKGQVVTDSCEDYEEARWVIQADIRRSWDDATMRTAFDYTIARTEVE